MRGKAEIAVKFFVCVWYIYFAFFVCFILVMRERIEFLQEVIHILKNKHGEMGEGK